MVLAAVRGHQCPAAAQVARPSAGTPRTGDAWSSARLGDINAVRPSLSGSFVHRRRWCAPRCATVTVGRPKVGGSGAGGGPRRCDRACAIARRSSVGPGDAVTWRCTGRSTSRGQGWGAWRSGRGARRHPLEFRRLELGFLFPTYDRWSRPILAGRRIAAGSIPNRGMAAFRARRPATAAWLPAQARLASVAIARQRAKASDKGKPAQGNAQGGGQATGRHWIIGRMRATNFQQRHRPPVAAIGYMRFSGRSDPSRCWTVTVRSAG